MKVFLSWSGEPSRSVALLLREWLPSVVQAVRPFMSSEDIDKGARWATDIAGELEDTDFGILCVTPGNLNSPWLNFEAGALSKAVDRSKVTPLLLGLRPTDLQGPLVQFQATNADRGDIQKLVVSLNNECGEGRLDEARLTKAFELWWPQLQANLVEAMARGDVAEQPLFDASKATEEILQLARSHQKILVALAERPAALPWVPSPPGITFPSSLLAAMSPPPAPPGTWPPVAPPPPRLQPLPRLQGVIRLVREGERQYAIRSQDLTVTVYLIRDVHKYLTTRGVVEADARRAVAELRASGAVQLNVSDRGSVTIEDMKGGRGEGTDKAE